MMRSSVHAGATLLAIFSLMSCGSGSTLPSGPSSEGSAPSPAKGADTTSRGRIEFGCALQRGIENADATTRRYADLASHELFRAALQADQGAVAAARLWDASDEVRARNTRKARAELLATCSDAGLDGRAGLPGLRSYMCSINAGLVRDRPTLASFGPEDTPSAPGDPRRTDASFVGTAQFLLAIKVDRRWFDAQNPVVALGNGDDEQYREAVREIAALCARH